MTLTVLAAVIAAGAVPAQGETAREERLRKLREAARQRLAPKILAVREAAGEFYAARERGDEEAAKAAVAKVRKAWGALPQNVRESIDRKYPGTGKRILSLADEHVPPAGRTYNHESTSVREGNTVSTTGQTTNGAGRVVRTYDGSTTREGPTTTHHHEVANGRGETLRTNDTTITRVDENTRERDTTITTRNDKTIDIDATKTRDGNTVDTAKTATITTPDGKTHSYTYTGQAVKDGNTVSKEGQWVNSNGKTIRTSETTVTREGNTATFEKEVKNGAGKTVRTHDQTAVREGGTVTREGTVQTRRLTKDYSGTAVKDGNTVTRSGSSTVTPRRPKVDPPKGSTRWQPKFRSSDDIFGGRPRLQRRAAAGDKPKFQRPGGAAGNRPKLQRPGGASGSRPKIQRGGASGGRSKPSRSGRAGGGRRK